MDSVMALGKNGLEAYPLQLAKCGKLSMLLTQKIVQKQLDSFCVSGDRKVFPENTEAGGL